MLLSGLGVVVLAVVAVSKPLHVIHITGDDNGYNDLGYFNGGRTHTPVGRSFPALTTNI